MLRVGFAGTPEFAVPTLEALIKSPEIQVECVYTQPDRPSGRGQKLSASAVKLCALSHNIPTRQPETLKIDHEISAFEALNLDALVVVAYGQILTPAILHAPRLGCLNVHASILPRWRGAAPLQRAIEAGDTETGITIMQMDTGLDTGAVLSSRTIAISNETTCLNLHDQLAQLGAPLLVETLLDLHHGRIEAAPQPSEGVTYATKISTEEAAIDWDQPHLRVMRHIHAFNPAPGAYCFSNDIRLKIYRVTKASAATREPGMIWQDTDGGVYVSATDGTLQVLECQLPGGKRLDAQAMKHLKQAPWNVMHVLTKQPV